MKDRNPYGNPPISKEYARWVTYFYKSNWPEDFARDERCGFSLPDSHGNKTDFDFRGNAEGYRLFKSAMLELLYENDEKNLDAIILGVGIPSGKLRLRKISEVVYFLLGLRNEDVMGDEMLLQELIHKHFLRKNMPINKESVEQQIQRIEHDCVYPRLAGYLDEHISNIACACKGSK